MQTDQQNARTNLRSIPFASAMTFTLISLPLSPIGRIRFTHHDHVHMNTSHRGVNERVKELHVGHLIETGIQIHIIEGICLSVCLPVWLYASLCLVNLASMTFRTTK